MMIRWIVCVLIGLACVTPLAAETPTTRIEKFGNAPLVFEPNYGQTDSSVRFLSRGDRYGLFLTDTEAIVSLAGSAPALVRMKLVGQNPHPRISGSGLQPGTSSYIKGVVASKWQQSVPHFLKVDYQEVYPGIDLTYYGNQRQLEYDFTVGPHANPRSIEMKFSGVNRMEIGDSGDLILHTAAGEIRHQHPRIFQLRNGVEETVEGRFVLLGTGKVGFRVGAYDTGLPLVIDPKFIYATYFGGAGANGDLGIDVKADAFGTAYVTGYTSSMDFFATNLSSTAPGGGNLDAFVMKVDSTGSTILSAMFYGGSGDDEGHRIALDGAGNIYITGYTTSANFPIVDGFQTKIGGRKDAYLVEIDNAATHIIFSSFLGGSLDDQPFGLSVSTDGTVYIAGNTLSSNFPLVRPIRSKFGGGLADGFVTKVSPGGLLIYSTYLGGRGNDQAFDVASDPDGNAYVVGFTSSSDFPLANAIFPKFRGGSEDAFITKLSPDGDAYLVSTYLGGSGTEEAVRVAVDSGRNIVISGYTSSLDFPAVNAFQSGLAGGFDVFVTKLNPDASAAFFSTYIGGDGTESAPGLALDAADNIYLAGFTSSFTFPVINGINIGVTGGRLLGDRDAYVLKLTSGGGLFFSTYIGGSSSDGAVGIATDTAGNAYITGFSFSTDFPVVNAFQPTAAGGADGILMKINADDVVIAAPFALPGQGALNLSTLGNSIGLEFGHASFDVPVSAKRPAGMAILDLRQSGAEVGEAALPLLPFITDGRVFVNEGQGSTTNLSIVNPSSEEVVLYFFMTNRLGVDSNFGNVTIPGKSALAQPVTGAPFFLPTSASGTLTFGTLTPVAAMAFRTFAESSGAILISYLPIVNPYDFETRPTTIAHFASDPAWQSSFLLVNNTDFQMTGQLQFFSNGPNQGDPTQSSTPIELALDKGAVSSIAYNIAPRGIDTFIALGNEIPTVSGYAQIVPDPGTFTPVGTLILTYSQSGIVSLHATVEAQIPATDFRLYAELSGDFDHSEGHATAMAFAISNPSDSPTTVTLTLVKLDGTATGLSSTFTLPAKGHMATYLHQMDDFKTMPNPFQGILKVHATGPGVVLFGMRGRISENGTYVGTTTGPIKENPGGGSTVIFPHILDGGGYATQIILFGDPSGQATTGTLSFADENGAGLPLTIQ